MTVDGVDCRVKEPYPFDKDWSPRWFSEKISGPGLCYEIAVYIMTGKICWVAGPFPCGLYNDWTIFKERGLMANLDVGERVEADNGYAAGDPLVCKTPGGPWHPIESQKIRRRVRARHESINCLVKHWGVLSSKYHHSFFKHGNCFRAVMVLTQLRILNGACIFSCDHYHNNVLYS